MLTHVEVTGYRLFDHFELSNLAPVNLIAGQNNAGKTSLLEAIFLAALGSHSGSATNVNVTRQFHALPEPVNATMQNYWRLLFRSMETDAQISIKLVDDAHAAYQLCASMGQEPLPPGEPTQQPASQASTSLREQQGLLLRYESPSGESGEVWTHPADQQGFRVVVTGDTVRYPLPVKILLQENEIPPHDAQALGQMRVARASETLLSALTIIEPRLVSIEESTADGISAIWGDIGLPEFVPLNVMGTGMSRLARLIIAMWQVKGGVILVDEIENGLHHSVLPKVWGAIDQAARDLDVQVIATTHSWECIVAASNSLESDRLRLTRLDVIDGCVKAIQYEPEHLEAAIDRNWEVR